MSTNNNTLLGWTSFGKGEALKLAEMPLKTWEEDDVEIQITDCGICGSDVHTLDSDRGPSDYPLVVGHEIGGYITRVGKEVTRLKVGDRVGLGPMSDSCGECEACKDGIINICDKGFFGTYNAKYRNGEKTFGGYANIWRGPSKFVIKLPDNVSNEVACTMLCGGITSYAPLRRANVGPGSIVGVMGVGGLGHFGILFAKALGARVIAMSHSEIKHDVAIELGADGYINTSDDEQMKKHYKSFTHVLCTGMSEDFTWEKYLPTLKPNGHFINVSAQGWSLPKMDPIFVSLLQVNIAGSAAGSPSESEEMLKLASEKNIKPWYQTYPMNKVNEALEDFRAGKPRFRFVLKN